MEKIQLSLRWFKVRAFGKDYEKRRYMKIDSSMLGILLEELMMYGYFFS